MRTLHVVGIGTGDPRQLTLHAVEVLAAVDVVLLLHKPGPADELTTMRAALVDRFASQARVVERADAVRDRRAPDYVDATERWREERVAVYESMLLDGVAPGESAAILVWGDPAVYDGTVEMLHRIDRRGHVAVTWDVVAGIGSPTALAAAHRTTLTRTASAVTVAPARRVVAGESGVGAGDDLVIMLDGPGGDGLDDLPDTAAVFWGAYLGTPDEVLVAGELGQVREQIRTVRERERARKGWIMDTCLVRGH